ncbi:hypothetical protein B0T22DRAFT_506003, partial [Podospora appendiculata]
PFFRVFLPQLFDLISCQASRPQRDQLPATALFLHLHFGVVALATPTSLRSLGLIWILLCVYKLAPPSSRFSIPKPLPSSLFSLQQQQRAADLTAFRPFDRIIYLFSCCFPSSSPKHLLLSPPSTMAFKRVKFLAVLNTAISASGHLAAEALPGAVNANLNKTQATTTVKVSFMAAKSDKKSPGKWLRAKILRNKSQKGETSRAAPVIAMDETPAPAVIATAETPALIADISMAETPALTADISADEVEHYIDHFCIHHELRHRDQWNLVYITDEHVKPPITITAEDLTVAPVLSVPQPAIPQKSRRGNSKKGYADAADDLRRWVSESDPREQNYENVDELEEFVEDLCRKTAHSHSDAEGPKQENFKLSWWGSVLDIGAEMDKNKKEYDDEQRQAEEASGRPDTSASIQDSSMLHHSAGGTHIRQARNLNGVQSFYSQEELAELQLSCRQSDDHENINYRGAPGHRVMSVIREEDEDGDEYEVEDEDEYEYEDEDEDEYEDEYENEGENDDGNGDQDEYDNDEDEEDDDDYENAFDLGEGDLERGVFRLRGF